LITHASYLTFIT